MLHLLVVTGVRFYREGLSSLLSARPQVAGCRTARDAAEARARLAAAPRPDVVLLDVALPGARELVATAAHPAGARVVVIAVGAGDDDVLPWAELGVAGYVGRDASVEEVGDAVEAAARGELRCSPEMAASLLRHLSTFAGLVRGSRAEAAPARLTAREHEIAGLIARGLTNKGIARHLGIGLPTAKNHVHNILRKLGVEHREDAAQWLRLHDPAAAHEARMDPEMVPA